MVVRYVAPVLIISLAGALSLLGSAHGQQEGPKRHDGRIIDYRQSTPVIATVKAWRNSDPTNDRDTCPPYGDAPLAAGTSMGDGTFTFVIDASTPTYTMVYCADGYYPRADRDLPNGPDGTPIIPVPARLWPIDENPAKSAIYPDAVRARLLVSLNELAYLRSLNAEAFNSVVLTYSKEVGGGGAEAVQALASATARWGNQK
ncbi:hypothetical protein [Inquilinus sp.]|uniref:hypothetical protein n=1 Tax=Inquilinus sp. TaxID=1932117 RepID=UPI0031DAC81C